MTNAASNVKGSYALVNGLNLYYEIHGIGQPLILLHGGFGLIEMFSQILPTLAQHYQVIAVDLQAHGRTADIDRPLRYEAMADDIAALVKHLGLDNADLLGFSLGGGVALQTAIRHPDLVRKLVLVSTPFRKDGWTDGTLAGMASIDAEAMKGTIMHESFINTAPKPDEWPRLAAQTKQLLGGAAYDWTAAVAALKTPTLVVVGDSDSVKLDHALEMFRLLGGGKADSGPSASQFAVLPGFAHWNMVLRADLLLPVVMSFLAPSLSPES